MSEQIIVNDGSFEEVKEKIGEALRRLEKKWLK
jgi:hypothetical protein